MRDAPYALQLLDIDKRFGGVHALRGARLEVLPGEIMGLCGENGAGKSTLLKVLAGVYPSGTYTGTVLVGGQPQKLTGPADARRSGISVVYQELTLVPELTVAQNLMLGREPGAVGGAGLLGMLDEAAMEAAARRDVARFGFADRIDVAKPVKTLGIGLQQMVEIVRALPQGARILVLDEPTAALTAQETAELLKWLKSLREAGTTCIYVSHRLDEVFELCDRITVLRDGRTAAVLVTAEVTPERVVAEMVGRAVTSKRSERAALAADVKPVLEVEKLCVRRATEAGDLGRRYAVEDLSFSLRPGEIVAVCGAMGAGRTALLSTLFGCAREGFSGSVRLGGVPLELGSPREAIAQGVALVPEDRKGRGIVPMMTVGENLALPSLELSAAMGERARVGLVDDVAETRLADRRIKELAIRGQSTAQVVTLSGGNQQKVVVGKWLERKPKVLLLDEPSRGVDVGAREEIYGILENLAKEGVAILFASSDLTEVLRLASRILVLRDGRCVGELDGDTATEASIVQLTTGAAAPGEPAVEKTAAASRG